MIDWRQSRVIAATVVALFFAVQLVVPIARLSHDRGQRFGWQMYSASNRPDPEFVVETSDGPQPIDLDDFLPTSRIEVDVTAYLPPHLCEVIPGAMSVFWNGGSQEC